MVELLPPIELVAQWAQEARKRGYAGLVDRAYTTYMNHIASLGANLHTAKSDKELMRFMPPAIDWKVGYAPQEPPFFLDLGQGAYLTDIRTIFTDALRLQSLTQLIERLENSSSTLQLLAASTCTHVQVLYVPRNVRIGEPIRLSKVSSDSVYNAALLFCILEEGAYITLYDMLHASKGIYIRSCIGALGAHAELNVISDYECGNSYTLISTAWLLDEGSRLCEVSAITGGKQTWAFKDFVLEGAHARVEHVSLSALKSNEQSALITRQQHKAPGTASAVHMKTVLFDEARFFSRGIISINEQSVQSDADQQQKALILSSAARSCSIPSLEIATHDVRCRHGSAAGRINKEELWYLQARGFDEKSAQNLLIGGFFNDHPLITKNVHAIDQMLGRLTSCY